MAKYPGNRVVLTGEEIRAKELSENSNLFTYDHTLITRLPNAGRIYQHRKT